MAEAKPRATRPSAPKEMGADDKAGDANVSAERQEFYAAQAAKMGVNIEQFQALQWVANSEVKGLRKKLEDLHDSGKRLNLVFGLPRGARKEGEKDQPDRDKEIAAAIKQLGATISASEVSRRRSLAAQFESIDALRRAHPTLKTWTEVKRILPKPSIRQKGAGQNSNVSARARKAAMKASDVLVQELRNGRFAFTIGDGQLLKRRLADAQVEVDAMFKLEHLAEISTENALNSSTSGPQPSEAGTKAAAGAVARAGQTSAQPVEEECAVDDNPEDLDVPEDDASEDHDENIEMIQD